MSDHEGEPNLEVALRNQARVEELMRIDADASRAKGKHAEADYLEADLGIVGKKDLWG